MTAVDGRHSDSKTNDWRGRKQTVYTADRTTTQTAHAPPSRHE